MRINLTKKEIINSLYMQIGFSKKISENLLEDILSIIVQNLKKHKKLKISNFGTFSIRSKKSRIGRNPKIITSDETTVKKDSAPILHEDNTLEYFHDASPETTHVDASALEIDSAIKEVCTLMTKETDALAFADAFQYYRECLGSDSNFQWKTGSYTTILAEDVIIQLADSVQVKEKTENNSEVSDVR